MTRMRKIFYSFILTVFSVIVMLSCSVGITKASALTSGIYTYTVTNGEASITDCLSTASGTINIPSSIGGYSVTSIGEKAFYQCKSITGVVIPSTVKSIGAAAFRECNALTSVTVPNGVTSIGTNAFYACVNLKTFTVPRSVTAIGSYAFYGCLSLTSFQADSANSYFSADTYGVLYNKNKTTLVQYPLGHSRTSFSIPSSVTLIGCGSFGYSQNLQTVTIPYGVKTIDSDAFFTSKSLKTVSVPNSVTSIGSGAFYDCDSLTQVTLSTSLTSISYKMFFDSDSLEDITIPSSVKKIEESAFLGCNKLKSITIPAAVTDIGSYAFVNCPSLTSITVNSSNQYYSSVDGVLFNKMKSTLIQYPSGKTLTSYSIPSTVKSLSDACFSSAASLKSVTIPKGITQIGYLAFDSCTKLSKVVIPDGVTTLGAYAFSDCTSLASVTLPKSVKSIGLWAFDGCSKLQNAYYLGTKSEWSQVSLSFGNTELSNALICHPSHTNTNLDGICDICEAPASDIFPGETMSVYVKAGNKVYLKFIPEASASYTFTSVSYSDTYGYLYDESKNLITQNDNSGENRNFLITYNLEAGKTYYWAAKYYSISYSGNIQVKLSAGSSSHTHVYYDACDKTCNICGAIRYTSHSFGSWTTVKAATCLETGTKKRTCSICGYAETQTISLSGHTYSNTCDTTCNVCGATRTISHSFGSWTTVKAATCTDSGSKKRTCSVCGYAETQIITALGHSWSSDYRTVIAPNCQKTGLGARYCTRCDLFCEMTDTSDLPESPHNYESYTTYTYTYSVEDAVKFKLNFSSDTKTESGYDYITILDENSNQIGKYSGTALQSSTVVVTGSSFTIKLTTDGTNNYYGFSLDSVVVIYGDLSNPTKTLEKAGHTLYKKNAKAATCTKGGYNTFWYCTVCKAYFTDAAGKNETTAAALKTAATGHKLQKTAAKAATCTQTGNKAYWTCTVCKKVFADAEGKTATTLAALKIPAGGHSLSVMQETPATCTASGSVKRRCSVCGYVQTQTLPALGHTYSNACDATCNVCSDKRTASHSYGSWKTVKKATCASVGSKKRTCSVCGYAQTKTIPVLSHTYSNACDTTCNVCGAKRTAAHSYGSWKTVKKATCTAAGSKKRTCSVCGYAQTQTIPVLSHTYSNACDATCNVCGAKRTAAHSYGSWKTVKKATCTAAGSKKRTCSVCGYAETQSTPALGHKSTTVLTRATSSKDGKIVKKCSVCNKDLSTQSIPKIKTAVLASPSYTYDTNVKTPSVTVKDSKGKTLKNGTDYSVKYASGRKNPGTYSVTVKYKGNYSGTKKLSFTISVGRVTDIMRTKSDSNVVAIQWRKVPYATKYEVQIFNDEKQQWDNVCLTKSSRIAVSNIKGVRKWRVRAIVVIENKAYYGAYSDILNTTST